ncbi:hypothetical protein L3X38_010121 [Prunus dulcis]|uniref:Uncharacterized protein n=1 Tax=Prunus dulcis TaxID=3755 RepID=A0AAD4ZE55_PRUDU|nr:hypothetical protein L3X38_010121 [Prunus dulcis]
MNQLRPTIQQLTLNHKPKWIEKSPVSLSLLCISDLKIIDVLIEEGHLDNAVIAVGSLSICVNINGFELMLFIGINVAISVRVSNKLGSGQPRAAKYSVYVTVFQCLLMDFFHDCYLDNQRQFFPTFYK